MNVFNEFVHGDKALSWQRNGPTGSDVSSGRSLYSRGQDLVVQIAATRKTVLWATQYACSDDSEGQTLLWTLKTFGCIHSRSFRRIWTVFVATRLSAFDIGRFERRLDAVD